MSINASLLQVADAKNITMQPGSGRKKMGNHYKTTDMGKLINDGSDENIRLSAANSLDRASVAPSYTRPVDAKRQSKVEQRQARRDEFRARHL